jgi:hypothetical protein
MHAVRYDPQISHLLFVVDPLLFADASIEQTHCIMHCLYLFCQASGQRITNQKKEIYFSKNVDQQLRDDILHHTGFKYINNINKYLGANIIPSRATR